MSRSPFLIALGIVVALALLVPAPGAMGTAEAAVHQALPAVSQQNDGEQSSQALDGIFGKGWQNLSGAASLIPSAVLGGDGPSLICDIIGVLNAACAVAVAWMIIMTTLAGSIGAAHEGKALAGRFSSPWVPIRFSFSLAAITPVFGGLNAMQLLILAGIGVSIDQANTVWNRGLEYVASYGVTAPSNASPHMHDAAAIVGGAALSATLIQYAGTAGGCTFPGAAEGNGYAAAMEWQDEGASWVLLLPVPDRCGSFEGGRLTGLSPGDFGGFRFGKAGAASPELARKLDETKKEVVASLIEGLQPLGRSVADRTYREGDEQAAASAMQAYAAAYVQAMRKIAALGDETRERNMARFLEHARERGWFLAGSFYWIASEANAQVESAMKDDTAYLPPDMETLAQMQVIRPDWATNAVRVLADVTARVQGTPFTARDGEIVLKKAGGQAATGIWAYFADLTELPARAALDAIDGTPDAILGITRMARSALNACEGGLMAMVAAKNGAQALAGGVRALGDVVGWLPKVGKAASSLADGVSGAITGTLADVMTLALVVIVPFAMAMWLFAHIIPAIPFLTWVACITGWIVLCVEAVVAAPIWLVGHCLPEGDGFAGVSGRAGYALFLSILLRPLLLVLSMFCCMMIMHGTGSLLGVLFTPYMDSIGAVAGGNVGVGAAIALMILLGVTVGLLTWKVFEIATVMPDRIIRWVGQLLANLGDHGERQTVGDVMAAGRYRGMPTYRQTATQLGRMAGVGDDGRSGQGGNGGARPGGARESFSGPHDIGTVTEGRHPRREGMTGMPQGRSGLREGGRGPRR
ncbi:MAG: DotA/TraY family protein [Desulfovibrio sp.]|jgi:hypothetical protein|nr:DotA/TraY family protein [Desulfovibrio sp.]